MEKKQIFLILTIITLGFSVYCCDIPIVHSDFEFLINHKNEGDLLYNIGVSFIAAYIFFIFQVCVPDYFESQKEIPIRAVVQREVQFFTIWIVNLWIEYYEYAKRNGFVGGTIEKNINVIFDENNMLEVLKRINILDICKNELLKKDITWKEYIKRELSKIITQGEQIKKYRADVLPPDIYYAIYYLTNESQTVFVCKSELDNPSILQYFGNNPTLEQMIIPESEKSEKNIKMDTECIRSLIEWVNQEYEYLMKQKKYSLKHIFKIELKS